MAVTTSDLRPQQAPGASLDPLDIGKTFDKKNILLIGTTGFVGKVVLSMLLRHYPNIGRVYALVRPGMGNSAESRFFSKAAASPAFDPLREVWRDGYDSFLRQKVVPIAGDIGRPLCNFDDQQFADFAQGGGLDLVINSAGLVSFTPSLESAIRINAMGAVNVLDAARKAGAALLHVSTCYVAGHRDGEVWEDEPVIGYFPRHRDINTRDFDAAAEIADCQRIIAQVREQANDRAHISRFREMAAERLREQRRDPEDENALKLAVARERKLWVSNHLRDLGQERAEHWGWTNTYTYTKSLGEQVLLADPEVRTTIVRPAIVESSLRYPFPGWNEGFNTTAPLVYLVLKGHRQVIAGKRTPLDVIPVDMVAAGVIQAGAAVIADRHRPIYQCGSSDLNPVFTERLAELTALSVRRHYRELADEGQDEWRNRARARMEAFPVSYDRFQRLSAPQIKRIADRVTAEIDERLPRWGAPRLTALAERTQDRLSRVSEFAGQVSEVIEMFKAFTYDHDIRFRCDNTRQLNRELTEHDQAILRWDPHDMDWREYWFGSHFPGLQRWVFPTLAVELGPKARSIYTHKDLLELFDATTKLHKHRVAMRLLPKPDDSNRTDEPAIYTYERVQDMAAQGAGNLRERGIGVGDRVMLMSENRPEWVISYFAVLKAGATAAPVDAQLSLGEVVNLLRASGAKVFIASAKVADRLLDGEGVDREGIDREGIDSKGIGNGFATPGQGAGDPEARAGKLLAALHTLIRERLDTAQASAEATDEPNGQHSGHNGAGQSDAHGEAAPPVQILGFDDVLVEPSVSAAAVAKVRRRSDAVASLIYTSGTTGSPKGVMLTHKNLSAMTSKLSSVVRLYLSDSLLSVLPLHHTLEFSAGMLMPLVHGSSITYLDEIDADNLSNALSKGYASGLVGVPALWQLLHRRIFKAVSERGIVFEQAFDAIVGLSRKLWDGSGVNIGRFLFYPLHRKLGGRMRVLISGGSSLPSDILTAFRGLGLPLIEGYGLTESSPVLTVMRPEDTPAIGSVGRALPGLDIRIDDPDDHGVGEVVARGATIMAGYDQNPDATAAVLQGGWLKTGDLGRFDEEDNLYIVGRKKDLILGPSGENVYPDELEDLYGDSAYIKEISVVGLPVAQGETVAALVVPDYDSGEREFVRAQVREHMQQISNQLPRAKRIKTFHLWDHDLPKTATRKVKRREVIAELERLERTTAMAHAGRNRAPNPGAGSRAEAAGNRATDKGGWLRDILAQVSQRPRAQIQGDTKLDTLGFESLMFSELVVALEAIGVEVVSPGELSDLTTVADIEAYLDRQARRHAHRRSAIDKLSKTKPAPQRERDFGDPNFGDPNFGNNDEIHIPKTVARIGRRGLRMGLGLLYNRLLDTQVRGQINVPPFGGYIVAANHASHLDMGLIKHALGDSGELLVTLAAKDYFFGDPVRKAYFENFTNLVPMERYGSLRESLRLAGDVIAAGHILLIFPEGTRSRTGHMTTFMPSLGYLAVANQCGILPMFLGGTYDAMPKGKTLPRRERVLARVGPFLTQERVKALAAGKRRSEGYRDISAHVESIVRRLAPPEYEWMLGQEESPSPSPSSSSSSSSSGEEPATSTSTSGSAHNAVQGPQE